MRFQAQHDSGHFIGGGTFEVQRNADARAQSFQNLGKDTITVQGQPRTATKVARNSDNKEVIVWVVDGLPVPARILQKKDGKDELDLVLKAVR